MQILYACENKNNIKLKEDDDVRTSKVPNFNT